MALVSDNPVVGGTVLRRAAIESPNFVHGVSGWIISQDGSAEFNNLTIRGTFMGTTFVINANGAFFYNAGETALVAAITGVATTDPVLGGPVPAGVSAFSTSGYADLESGSLTFHLTSDTNDGGLVPTPGPGPSDVPSIIMISPSNVATVDDDTQAVIAVVGESSDSTVAAYVFMGSNQFGSTNIADVQVLIVGTLAFAESGVAGGALRSLGPTLSDNGASGFLLGATAAGTPATTALLELQGGTGQVCLTTISDVPATNGLNVEVAGDTSPRFRVAGSGNLGWGSGAAPVDIVMARLSANRLSVQTADFSVRTAGRGLQVAEGSNAKQGIATLSGGTVVVANTAVTANSRIQLTAQDNNSVGALRVSARTPATSFTITSNVNTDSGVVAYEIFEPG